jgi:hypothetical protein
LPEGFSSLPINWYRTLFVYDIFVKPEIVPGYNKDDFYNIRFYIDRVRTSEAFWRKALYLFSAIMYFAPGYLYRLSIKSTFWLYYGLAFVVTGAKYVRGHILGEVSIRELRQEPDLLVDIIEEDPRRMLRWLMILVGFAALIIGNAFAILDKIIFLPFKLPFLVEYLVLIDLSSIKIWHAVGIIIAGLTVAISYKSKHLKTYLKNIQKSPIVLKPIKNTTDFLLILLGLRNVASRAMVILIAVHAILWLSPAQRFLPEQFIQLFRYIYRDSMPVAAQLSKPSILTSDYPLARRRAARPSDISLPA